MSKKQYATLKLIMDELKAGKAFGKHVYNVKYPYFDFNLWISPTNYIHWKCYGESAHRVTMRDLAWIIRVIFKTTPIEFYKTHSVYVIR